MTKVTKLCGLALLCAAFIGGPARANQWVDGYVSIVEEYAGYDGGAFGVLVGISSPTWAAPPAGSPSGAGTCASRFAIVAGKAGVDEASKNRMFSILLSAGAARKKVRLWVDTSESYCKVAIASVMFE
jgi:hypothetical protein